MEKLIRDLNDRHSKDRNIINVNQDSFFLKNIAYAANLILNEIINVLIMAVA